MKQSQIYTKGEKQNDVAQNVAEGKCVQVLILAGQITDNGSKRDKIQGSDRVYGTEQQDTQKKYIKSEDGI